MKHLYNFNFLNQIHIIICTRDHDARYRARPNAHWRCNAPTFQKRIMNWVQSLSRCKEIPVKNKGKKLKKSVFSIFIYDTIGFLDRTHRVANFGFR